MYTEANEFRPTDLLTRAEAAVWLVNAFKLPEIHPMHIETAVEKKFTYDNGLGVINEAFAVPSAKDTVNHPAENYIEGLIKVRAIEPVNGEFFPDQPIARNELALVIGKIIFGVDEPLDYKAKLALVNSVFPTMFDSDSPITREEVAQILSSMLVDSNFKVVTILTTTDIHGHISPYKPSGATYPVGAMAKMANIVEATRAKQPNTLLVDVGDAPYNTNVANLFEGRPVIEIMNLMGYDAMAIGNHDFDFPFDIMERNAGLAKFPFLSANTYYKGEYPAFLKPYIIKEVDGIKIAIIGLTDDESAWYTHPRNVAGITFKDNFEAAKETVDAVKDKADVVIALAHLHGDNNNLSKNVAGFDLVFGGGTDIVAYPERIGDSWLLSSGKHGELISQTNMNFINDNLVGFTFSHIFMTENLEDNETVVQLATKYEAGLDDKLGLIIGKTLVDLDGERGTVRLKESNLGNIIADSLKEFTGSDIAFQNGGGIRASIGTGDITLKDVYTILPFDNLVVVQNLTGKTVWDAIEHGVSVYPGAAGQFLQVSGIEYTFDAAKAPGSRLISVTIDGNPIDLEKVYSVTVNDFLSGGGDKYIMLQNSEVTKKTMYFLRDVFAEYLQKVGTIAPELESRITVLNPAQ